MHMYAGGMQSAASSLLAAVFKQVPLLCVCVCVCMLQLVPVAEIF